MRAINLAIVTLFLSIITAQALAINDNADNHYTSSYLGEENRQIKALSEKDVNDLVNGRGWGFAKAAELNGLPGPSHILEMANEIQLTDDQRKVIETLFKEMKDRAIPLGKNLVELERQLDQMLAKRTATKGSLKNRIQAIGKVRSELRLVHLQTHLNTPDILTSDQVALYNELRGYSNNSGHRGHH